MTTPPFVVFLCTVGVFIGLFLMISAFNDSGSPSSDLFRWVGRRWQRLRGHHVGRRAAAAVAAGVLAGLFTGWVAGGILAALAVWALPTVWGSGADHQRRVARIEAIAVWTEMLRDTLSAAAGLEQALLASAPIAPDAIRADVQALARRIHRGDALADALQDLAHSLDDPTGDLVVSALLMAAGHPARQLADLLGELAVQAREQVSMRLRVEAGRARTRTTVRLIVGTTLVLVVGMVVFNRGYLAPYDSLLGQGVLLVVGGLFAVSFWWLDRMARQDDGPERVLTNLSAIHREGDQS